MSTEELKMRVCLILVSVSLMMAFAIPATIPSALYGTYVGGKRKEGATGLAVDSQGRAINSRSYTFGRFSCNAGCI